MNSGLTHIGAIARGLAYAPAPASRSWGQAADARVSAVKPTAPVENEAEAREQVRDQIMAERGVDGMSLFQLGSQDRISAETAIMVETAMRALKTANQERAQVRPTGSLVDLRV